VDEAAGVSHALLLAPLAAMAGFCLTGDLFNLFVFFELMAVSAFALTVYHTRSPAALRSALNFAITNTVGVFLVLIGIALLHSRTGALNLAQIGRQLAAAGHADRLTIIALSALLAGFLIKAAVVPFHFWIIDTASAAPIPLAMILAGVLDTLGVYAIARIYWTVFVSPAGRHHAVQTVLIAIGALSATAGGVLAVTFRHPRRRLAFVMVAHTGILLIGVGCLTAGGVAGSAVYAVGDGAVKAALWAGLALIGLSRPADRTTPARPDALETKGRIDTLDGRGLSPAPDSRCSPLASASPLSRTPPPRPATRGSLRSPSSRLPSPAPPCSTSLGRAPASAATPTAASVEASARHASTQPPAASTMAASATRRHGPPSAPRRSRSCSR
jgi:multicomponent Na+:H+ antiporter subunit D